MTTKRKFERHFSGRDNAGLRKRIRDAADGVMPACGPVVERAVLNLASRIAFTATGRSTLASVAADYRTARGEHENRCDCRDCYAANLQYLGAAASLANAEQAGESVPPCAASMGCLCAGHARGNAADAPCDTRE